MDFVTLFINRRHTEAQREDNILQGKE